MASRWISRFRFSRVTEIKAPKVPLKLQALDRTALSLLCPDAKEEGARNGEGFLAAILLTLLPPCHLSHKGTLYFQGLSDPISL